MIQKILENCYTNAEDEAELNAAIAYIVANGDTCRYTDLQTVIDYLEKSEATEHRRRNAPAIAMLKAYAAEQWDDEMIVIHYGY